MHCVFCACNRRVYYVLYIDIKQWAKQEKQKEKYYSKAKFYYSRNLLVIIRPPMQAKQSRVPLYCAHAASFIAAFASPPCHYTA